jgi:tRNA (guanosine-2'-O-)-methyltransferase
MSKSTLRIRADKAKVNRCKNLIAVLENPKTIENIGSTIRNIDALGVEKLYVVDGSKILPKKWDEMRDRNSLNKLSASAIKWSFVRVFPNTEECLSYLKTKNFVSIVTSPHLKGKNNVILHNGKYTQKRLAVWFGNESQGVSQKAIDNSEVCVNIPMSGIIESLNLGTSTGIVLYEITKQRREFLENKSKMCKK